MYPTKCNVTDFILSDNCSTVSGVTTTHHQKHKTIVTRASGICHTVLLSAVIMEELEMV
jgi:hypothetical protein